MEIDLTGLNKADVLRVLYNNARPMGFGFLQADNNDMTTEEAKNHLKESRTKDFDYLKGRCLKIDLSGNTLDPWLYDRDYGEGKAAELIKNLKGEN